MHVFIVDDEAVFVEKPRSGNKCYNATYKANPGDHVDELKHDFSFGRGLI
jgi:hypothetical protein